MVMTPPSPLVTIAVGDTSRWAVLLYAGGGAHPAGGVGLLLGRVAGYAHHRDVRRDSVVVPRSVGAPPWHIGASVVASAVQLRGHGAGAARMASRRPVAASPRGAARAHAPIRHPRLRSQTLVSLVQLLETAAGTPLLGVSSLRAQNGSPLYLDEHVCRLPQLSILFADAVVSGAGLCAHGGYRRLSPVSL
eukprot:ctg_2361.g665